MISQLHYDMEGVIMEIETDDGAKVTMLTVAGDSWSAGMKAVEMKLANIAVPRASLEDETRALTRELMENNPVVLGYTKQAVKAVRQMDVNMAYECLRAKSLAQGFADTEDIRNRGMTEFLDRKPYHPGFRPVGKTS